MALFEAGKGAMVLIHCDAQAVAEEVVRFLRMNPANSYPAIFIDALLRTIHGQLWFLALAAFAYATVRFVEAFELWRGQAWAEWFGTLTGGIHIPFQLSELSRKMADVRLGVLIVNVAIVGYLSYKLWRSRQRSSRKSKQEGGPA